MCLQTTSLKDQVDDLRTTAHDEAAASGFQNQELKKQLESMNEAMDKLEDQNAELESSVSAKREERDNALDKVKQLEQEVDQTPKC